MQFSPNAMYIVAYWTVPFAAIVFVNWAIRRGKMSETFAVYDAIETCQHCKVSKKDSRSPVCPYMGVHTWVISLQEKRRKRSGWWLLTLLAWDALLRRS